MSVFFFVGFLLTTQLFRLMRIVTRKGIDFTLMSEIFMQIAFSFIPMAVPISILFAMIYCLNKLSEDSEIVAIRAMGVNKSKMFMPFFIIAVMSAVCVFGLNRRIIPLMTKDFKNTIQVLTSKGFLADIKKEKFYTDIPNVTLFSEDVYDDGKKLERVFIKFRQKDGKDRVIFAKRGALIKNEDINNPSVNIRLDLFEGNIVSIDKTGKEVEKILFEKYEFPIISDTNIKSVSKDSMLTSDQLSAEIYLAKQRIKDETDPKKLKDFSYRLKNLKMEYWSRFNTPLQCLAFVLIGFVFGIKKGRGKSGNMTVYAFISVLVYYALFFSGVTVIKKTEIPPALVIMFPTLLTFILGTHFYKKIDWAS